MLLLVAPARPEKFSHPAATLTYSIFFLPPMPGLTQIPSSSIPSEVTPHRHSASVKQSSLSQAEDRKEGFAGGCWGAVEQGMCSLDHSQFSSAQFLKFSLFFPSSRFNATLLLVTSLLPDTGIHIRECH